MPEYLDKTFCTNEIAKLSGLDFWPKEREGKLALVTALQHFDTNQKAQKFISDWLTYQTQCPKPAEIREAAYREQGDRPHGCTRCAGRMFVSERRVIDGKYYDFSAMCECHPGKKQAS